MNSNKKFQYKYWSYDICQTLDNLPDKVLDNFKPKGRFYDDCVALFEILTISPHPSLNSQVGKDSIEPILINFDNILIDINTLRIFFYLLPNTKIITVKFSKNSFEYANLEYLINNLINKSTNIYNVFLEWNSDVRHDSKIIKSPETVFDHSNIRISEHVLEDESRSYNINNTQVPDILLRSKLLIAKLSAHPRLDSLCLRGNYLGDSACIIIFENLKVNQSLRVLNLYKNSISSRSTPFISQMLEVNRKLEEINLGGNLLTDDDFKIATDQLGKFSLSEEEVDTYNKKIKEKNEILEKNKKLKIAKKPELPLPIIQEVEIVGEHYFMFKNNRLKTLNLMQNHFSKGIFTPILKTIERTEDLLIVLDLKIFDKLEKDKMADPKNKFSSKVYLTK